MIYTLELEVVNPKSVAVCKRRKLSCVHVDSMHFLGCNRAMRLESHFLSEGASTLIFETIWASPFAGRCQLTW